MHLTEVIGLILIVISALSLLANYLLFSKKTHKSIRKKIELYKELNKLFQKKNFS